MTSDAADSSARRDFLKRIGAGGAALCTPAFLAGCVTPRATDLRIEAPQNPFLTWFGIDESTLMRAMSELSSHGATMADIYLQHRRRQNLRLQDGVLDFPDALIERGAGFRVNSADHNGFAFTEDLTPPGLLSAARVAAQGATAEAVETPRRFADGAQRNNFYAIRTNWSDVAADQRLPVLERASSSAQAADPAVTEVTVDWQDSDERVLIATLDGQLHTDRRPLTRLSVQVVVQRGAESHSGFASMSARQGLEWYEAARIDEIAKTAVARAVVRFDARQPPLGEMPVVLAAATSGIVLHEALGHALEADFSAPGAGPFAGRVGELVAAPVVTLIDDATMLHERGALNIDDEGTPGQRTVLIEKGKLQTFLHDRSSGAQAGVPSTGSGRRESYRHIPLPRMSCTRLQDGSSSFDDLLTAARRGVLADTYSGGQVDPVTGDFSFKINTGWFIENGKRSFPVRDLTLSGSGPALLANVQQLANDGRMDTAGWTCGKRGQRVPVSHGMPSALVNGLRISA